jgi:predicted nucleic acid-binding protein
MIVVSDTSPINYLVMLGYIEVLPQIFGTVIIPTEVHRELTAPDTPIEVLEWLDTEPDWLQIQSSTMLLIDPTLHPGECSALGLAMEIQPNYVLIDDLLAREVAEIQGLRVTGTVGILERAHQADLLDLHTALDALQATNFRISDALIKLVKDRNP